jgi:hypothetical protein
MKTQVSRLQEKGKPVKTITTDDTSNQQKENPNNVNNNKATYASVAASGLNHQTSQNLENTNINLTLQLILTKITNLEGAFSNMNERVKKLESDTHSK